MLPIPFLGTSRVWYGVISADILIIIKVSLQRHNHKSQQKPSQPTLKRRFFKKKAAFFHGPVWERSGADLILKRKGEFLSWPGREVWPFFISRKRRLANG